MQSARRVTIVDTEAVALTPPSKQSTAVGADVDSSSGNEGDDYPPPRRGADARAVPAV